MSSASGRRAQRAEGQRLLDSLALDYLDRDDVSRASMFGSTGLQVNGKFFAVSGAEGQLVTKVPAAQAETLLVKGEVGQVRAGRSPMRAWISVPVPVAGDGPGQWRALLGDAYDYVRSLTSVRQVENATSTGRSPRSGRRT